MKKTESHTLRLESSGPGRGFTQHHFSKKSGAGFTLVETLVSILVFSVVLTAVFYLLAYNLKAALLIENNFVASGLVQEGMEVVRNIRDNDWHLDNPFGTSIPDGTYRVQWSSQTLLPSSADPCPASLPGGPSSCLKKDAGTGFFSYDAGSDTVFKRTIIISAVSGAEKRIVVTVSWNERGIPKSVSAEDHLFDWR